jgi:hypothetical protein
MITEPKVKKDSNADNLLIIKVESGNNNLPCVFTDVCRICQQTKNSFLTKIFKEKLISKSFPESQKLIFPCQCLLPVHKRCLIMRVLSTNNLQCASCNLKYNLIYKKLSFCNKICQLKMIKSTILTFILFFVLLFLFFYTSLMKIKNNKFNFWKYIFIILLLVCNGYMVYLVISHVVKIKKLILVKTFDIRDNKINITDMAVYSTNLNRSSKFEAGGKKITNLKLDLHYKTHQNMLRNFLLYNLKIDQFDIIENKFICLNENKDGNTKLSEYISSKNDQIERNLAKKISAKLANDSVYYTSRRYSLNNGLLGSDIRTFSSSPKKNSDEKVTLSNVKFFNKKVDILHKYSPFAKNKIEADENESILSKKDQEKIILPELDPNFTSKYKCQNINTSFQKSLEKIRNQKIGKKHATGAGASDVEPTTPGGNFTLNGETSPCNNRKSLIQIENNNQFKMNDDISIIHRTKISTKTCFSISDFNFNTKRKFSTIVTNICEIIKNSDKNYPENNVYVQTDDPLL